MSFNLFKSALINGRGQYNGNNAPLPWFTVEADSEIGFYMINSGIEYTFSISIDQHDMEITSLGVGQVESRTVNTIYLNPGERVKVKLQANRPINNYWIRATTLDGQGEALGVLHYEGFHTTNQEPKSSPTICTNKKPCTIYNCPSSDVPDKSTKCVASYQFKGTDRALALRNKVQEVDLEVFLDFAFPIGASINGYRFVNPKNHLYSSNPMDKPCTKKDCYGKGCYCTHYIGGHNFTITHYDILYCKGMKLNNFFYSPKTCISLKSELKLIFNSCRLMPTQS